MSGGIPPNDRLRGAFTLDRGVLAEPGVRQAWEAQIGRAFDFPVIDPPAIGRTGVQVRAARLRELAISDVAFAPPMRSAAVVDGIDGLAWLYVVERGAWTIGGPAPQTVPAGRFLLRHVDRPLPACTAPGTRARVAALPSNLLEAPPHNRVVSGPADAAEARLLMAHADTIHTTIAELGPAGVQAAHDAAVELIRAMADGGVDGAESQLTPALVAAAMTLIRELLSEPELSPELLARRLFVSRRTLQRAFANEGLSVAASIRDQRLEAVRRALGAPLHRPSVTELAARWQFADGSHLTRAFKRKFGTTPSDYARMAGVERRRAVL